VASGAAEQSSGTRVAVTPLKSLCRARHIQTYACFGRAYDNAAAALGAAFIGVRPSEKTFRRWLAGEIGDVPRAEHCLVLEVMFTGWTARQLFGLDPPDDGAVTPATVARSRSDPDERGALVASAEDSAEFLAWAELGNVGDLTIEQIQVDVRRLARAYLKTDTGPLVERAVDLRGRLFELLRGRQKPAQTRELFGAAGWTLTLLAWISIDLKRPDVAETHLRTARLCADYAEYGLLRAWIAATRHSVAFWEDDYQTAVGQARNGLVDAPAGSGAALLLTSAVAVDLAYCGDHIRAREMLTEAQRRVDELGAADADGMEGPFACAVGRAGSFWADTHLVLGQPEDALRIAAESVHAFEASPPGERNLGSERMVRCQQVKAHMAMREYDGASEALQPVLQTVQEHRVGPLVRRVSEIATLAGAARDAETPLLREILDHATEFTRLPAALPRRGIGWQAPTTE